MHLTFILEGYYGCLALDDFVRLLLSPNLVFDRLQLRKEYICQHQTRSVESLTVEVLIITIVKAVAQFCLERERPIIRGVQSLITSSTCIPSHVQDVCRPQDSIRTVPHIHKPVLGTRYSGTIPRRKTCTNHDITLYNVQLHIDDALLMM